MSPINPAAAIAAAAAATTDDRTKKGASPRRPRHQITRSLSEISQPNKQPNHRSLQSVQHHWPNHRHHHSLRGGGGGEETDRIPVPQSAFPALQQVRSRSSLEGHRPVLDAVAPSPIPSRRASVLISGGGDAVALPGTATTVDRKGIRGEDGGLLSAKSIAEATATTLRTAVGDLSNFSASTTKRLDETYSSVLEKAGLLQGTVAALRELSGMWVDVNDAFGRETDELQGEVGSQLEALGDFTPQQRRIESLQTRIHNNRERIQRLSGRVDVVRSRIEGWERADREWQERTRRRLKTLWVLTSVAVLFVAVLLLFVAARYGPMQSSDGGVVGGDGHTTPRFDAAALSGEATTQLSSSERLFRSLNMSTAAEDSSRAAAVEERLRLFDEL